MGGNQRLKRKSMMMILLVFSLLSGNTDAACPTGWDSASWLEQLKEGCYKFTTSSSNEDSMTYSEASSSCDSIGGKIVVFNSYEELENVGNTYSQAHIAELGIGFALIWVGCTDQAVEGTFVCEDGTQLALDSALWLDGPPSSAGSGGGSNDCIYYGQDYNGLTEHTCDSIYGLPSLALCEVDPIPEQTTTPPPHERHRSGFYSMAKDNNGSPMIDYCLSDHVMKTLPMKNKLHCAAECEKEPGCMSFNYRDGKCELNAETKNGASSSSFSQREGCLYYEPI